MHLHLLAFDIEDKEIYIPFEYDINEIHGYYVDAVDSSIVNLFSYGQQFSVKKTHALMAELKYKSN
jgi:hypothetical protein